ncbi:MAG: helix-turn-helix domain-containing protein [Kofleriaceae bacterium]
METSSVPEPTAPRVPTLEEVVRDHIGHIGEVLAICGNHKARTAQALGIDRTTLWKKLREYGYEPAQP